jgi:hypothetical protein
MPIWINITFNLDTACTNVEYATGVRPSGDCWIRGAVESIASSGASLLYLQAGTRYYGYL